MRVRRLTSLPSRAVDGLPGVRVRRVGRIGSAELKLFALSAGTATPLHQHEHRHVVVVRAGAGTVRTPAGGEREIHPDQAVVTAPREPHGFAAAADAPLEFFCLDASGNT